MSATPAKGSVILLHGHGRTRFSMRKLAQACQRGGYRSFALGYNGHGKMESILAGLHGPITTIEQAADGPLHFITHSLGGLVARAYITKHRPERLGRVVMLAPPNKGSELADLLSRLRLDHIVLGHSRRFLTISRAPDHERFLGVIDYELGVIAGSKAIDPLFSRLILPTPNDGKVSVAATHVVGMKDFAVLPVPHTLMPWEGCVIAHCLQFLERGDFGKGEPHAA